MFLMMKRIGKTGPCLCFVVCHKRACAKAFRNVLAWVVVLAVINDPAEEMDGVHNGGHEGQREVDVDAYEDMPDYSPHPPIP